MILSKDTFKAGRQYSKDELTSYFADAQISEDRIKNRNYLFLYSGGRKWTFAQDKHGKYVLEEA